MRGTILVRIGRLTLRYMFSRSIPKRISATPLFSYMTT
jgi:hypothetical protein